LGRKGKNAFLREFDPARREIEGESNLFHIFFFVVTII